jgi:hypothetical protein
VTRSRAIVASPGHDRLVWRNHRLAWGDRSVYGASHFTCTEFVMSVSRAVLLLRLSMLGMLAVAPAVPLSPVQGQEPPGELNQSLNRQTDEGLYRVRVISTVAPVPVNAVHNWDVDITDMQGKPVAGAVVRVEGGMPENKQGLLPATQVAAGNNAGHYVISGLKFSMGGRWEVKLMIEAAEGVDSVTFNIVL